MKLMICTSNKKKFEEISSILGSLKKDENLDLEFVKPPKELEVEEYANTFLSNAHLKAKAYYNAFGIPALADDSGLVVDAFSDNLERPGVYSARFYKDSFGSHVLKEEVFKLSKDELNNLKVLRLLEKEENRKAKFVSVVAIVLSNNYGIFGEGELKGYIAKEPFGNFGFGYDPIFIPEGYNTTLANIENKDKISHRRKALEAVFFMLKKML
ncbi:MAG: RdgB/HAM1 family non-canonical purine NTP pyrophosphatase [Hydrogenobaculum sp.]|jgi:XTP/dITP diphosphohydrolase